LQALDGVAETEGNDDYDKELRELMREQAVGLGIVESLSRPKHARM
jgi:hypothetical protein